MVNVMLLEEKTIEKRAKITAEKFGGSDIFAVFADIQIELYKPFN